jgi:hypothetical protein
MPSLIWDVQFIPTQCFFFPGSVFSLTRSGFSNPVFFFSPSFRPLFYCPPRAVNRLLCPISMDFAHPRGCPPMFLDRSVSPVIC